MRTCWDFLPFFISFSGFLEYPILFFLHIKSLLIIQLLLILPKHTNSYTTALFQDKKEEDSLGESWALPCLALGTVTFLLPSLPLSSASQCLLTSRKMAITTVSKTYQICFVSVPLSYPLPLHRRSFLSLLCPNPYASFMSQFQFYLLCHTSCTPLGSMSFSDPTSVMCLLDVILYLSTSLVFPVDCDLL